MNNYITIYLKIGVKIKKYKHHLEQTFYVLNKHKNCMIHFQYNTMHVYADRRAQLHKLYNK